jgi:hypothetical protein
MLKAGDRIEFIVETNGRAVLVPATVDVSEPMRLLAPAPRQGTLGEMEATIRKRAS